MCQSRKNNPTNFKPPLFPIPSDTYTLPFESIALDFIVKLPQSDTYDTILTITDTFSKASILMNSMVLTSGEVTGLSQSRVSKQRHSGWLAQKQVVDDKLIPQ